MVEIKRIMCNPLQENCYVISDESKECVIIDCGVYYQDEKDALIAYIRDKQLTPTHLIATHGSGSCSPGYRKSAEPEGPSE